MRRRTRRPGLQIVVVEAAEVRSSAQTPRRTRLAHRGPEQRHDQLRLDLLRKRRRSPPHLFLREPTPSYLSERVLGPDKTNPTNQKQYGHYTVHYSCMYKLQKGWEGQLEVFSAENCENVNVFVNITEEMAYADVWPQVLRLHKRVLSITVLF